MQLLFITHDLDSGGSARSLSVLVRELAGRHRISILSLQGPDPGKAVFGLYRDMGVTLYTFPWGWLPVSYEGCFVDADQQRERCERQRPHVGPVRELAESADVICFNGYPSASLASVLPRRVRKVLIAREVVDTRSPHFVSVMAYLRRFLSAAVAIGPVEAKQLAQAGIPHVTVFNTSPEPPVFRPLPPMPPVHFGVFGQITSSKGQDVLLKGCAAVAAQLIQNEARVHLFGAPVPESFVQFVKAAGLEQVVRFEGWVDDVETRMADMHCIVRPDRTGSPWGRDVIEAMSIGRPVLATGTEEVFIRPGKTGWLVPPGNPAILGRTIALLAGSGSELATLARNAFAFAREHFDPHVNAARVEAVLTGTDGMRLSAADKFPGGVA